MSKTLIAVLAATMLSGAAFAQTATATANDAYAPYARLIGAWQSNDGAIVQRFSWGPSQSYILYSTTTRGRDGIDHLHFEGIMIYNAQSQNLDFLIALEPGSLSLERGSVHAEAGGAIVRDVEAIDPRGAQSRFRQTFRLTSADAGETSLMRDDGRGGWTPTFPGADHLAMRRIG